MPRCASNGSARIRRTVPGSFGEPRWPPVRLLPRCSSPPPVDVHILRQSATRAVGYPCTVQLEEAIGNDGAEPEEGWLLQYSGHAAAALARWATAGMTLQIDGCRYRCIRPAVAQAPRSETIRGNRRLVNAARGQRGADAIGCMAATWPTGLIAPPAGGATTARGRGGSSTPSLRHVLPRRRMLSHCPGAMLCQPGGLGRCARSAGAAKPRRNTWPYFAMLRSVCEITLRPGGIRGGPGTSRDSLPLAVLPRSSCTPCDHPLGDFVALCRSWRGGHPPVPSRR